MCKHPLLLIPARIDAHGMRIRNLHPKAPMLSVGFYHGERCAFVRARFTLYAIVLAFFSALVQTLVFSEPVSF
jgi:hypothetical protein